MLRETQTGQKFASIIIAASRHPRALQEVNGAVCLSCTQMGITAKFFALQSTALSNQNCNGVALIRMAITKKSTNNKFWRRCGEKGTLLLFLWECKLMQPLWRIELSVI